ncbi:MAG: M1 family metallopeptidase [Alphaproteobacteria bacterium]|nr:M1 family metallopeptidase [Alphaproteobacteria bacterium]
MAGSQTEALLSEARCGGLVLHSALLADGAAPGAKGQPFAEPGALPRYAPDRGFDIGEIRLQLTVAPARGTLSGVAEIDVRPLPAGLGDVVLDLDDVDVDGVTDADGAELSWRHGDGRLTVRGLPAGGGTVVVRYHGRPVRGMYFTGPTAAHPRREPMAWTQCQDEDGHFVFPCLDHPGVRHPWRLSITVDADGSDLPAEDWTVVSTGAFQGRDGATWRWSQPEPIPAYLINVIVGRLAVFDDRSVRLADGRDLPVRYLVPAVDNDGVPADEAQVRRAFGQTPAMIEFLSQRLGVPFPWARYDQIIVHDFIFGGMENVAATTMTDIMLLTDRAALDKDFDDLVVHELMHQWFGDLVTCQDWSQGWLNEGWATYSEHLWKEFGEDAPAADFHNWENFTAYLAEDGGRYRRAIVSYRFVEPIDVFDRHLYQKASLVIHGLRHELGDAAFFAGVKAYLDGCALSAVHTRDFQRALESASGRNLDRTFRERIWGAGHPELTVALSHEDGLLKVQVSQNQAHGPVAGDPEHVVAEAFAMVLPVTVVHGDEEQTVRLRLTERSHGFALPMAEAPDRVEVDPRFRVLADLTVKAPRDWLIASLRHDRGVVGRIRAARALAEDGSPQAIGALCAALAAESFWGVRAELAALLGKHGGEAARKALLAALDDVEGRVRRSVVEALSTLRHPDVARALLGRARDGDPHLFAEAAALSALGGMVAGGAVGVVTPDAALAALRDGLGRTSWGQLLQTSALAGLAATRDEGVLGDLLAHTDDSYPERVRAAAAAGLGSLAGQLDSVRRPAVDRLMELAREDNWRVRFTALSALGGARDPRARGVLHHVHATALEGRLRRTAWEADARLAGSVKDPAAELRRQVETLRKQEQKLRDRVDALEARATLPE